jgi:hypothetical protein
VVACTVSVISAGPASRDVAATQPSCAATRMCAGLPAGGWQPLEALRVNNCDGASRPSVRVRGGEVQTAWRRPARVTRPTLMATAVLPTTIIRPRGVAQFLDELQRAARSSSLRLPNGGGVCERRIVHRGRNLRLPPAILNSRSGSARQLGLRET